jgi:hypothetical protein
MENDKLEEELQKERERRLAAEDYIREKMAAPSKVERMIEESAGAVNPVEAFHNLPKPQRDKLHADPAFRRELVKHQKEQRKKKSPLVANLDRLREEHYLTQAAKEIRQERAERRSQRSAPAPDPNSKAEKMKRMILQAESEAKKKDHIGGNYE